MTSIGIRASTTEVIYSILEQDDTGRIKIVLVTSLLIPVSLNVPEQLNFVRKTFKDIILEFKVQQAGIRITESYAPNSNVQRIYLEAIIQEVFASSSIQKYMTGVIANITSKLGLARNDFKKIISGDTEFSLFTGHNFKPKEMECMLVGIAALKL